MVLLAPVVMGAAKFNYGMEIRDEDHVRSTFVYGVSRADLEEAGKKPSDFSDCDKTFDVSASDKQHGVKAEFVEDKEYVGCKFTMTTTADDARGAGLGLTFDADKVSLSIGRKFFEDARLDKIKVGAFKVSVTFPGKVISHSGSSSVDGNTVTWTDIKDSTSGLKAVGERPTGAATAGPSFWKGFGRHGIRGGSLASLRVLPPTLVISDVRRKSGRSLAGQLRPRSTRDTGSRSPKNGRLRVRKVTSMGNR